MQQFLLPLLALATGAVVTTYLTVNTFVSNKVGSDIQANLPYFLLALVTTFAIFAFRQDLGNLSKFTEVPWWAFLTGVAGGVALYATTLLIGEIGADKFFVASVAGQLIVSVLIAHFGWFESAQSDVTWQKVLGVTLAIGGAALVTGLGGR